MGLYLHTPIRFHGVVLSKKKKARGQIYRLFSGIRYTKFCIGSDEMWLLHFTSLLTMTAQFAEALTGSEIYVWSWS